jgi:DNA-binding transcriptional ArsR family regulator
MAYQKALDALGDRTRRLIFSRLRDAPGSVGALAEGLPISRPAVSQHLKVLKDAGLVTDEAAGARRIYRAAPGGLVALKEWLDGLYDELFTAHKHEIQRQMDERRNT